MFATILRSSGMCEWSYDCSLRPLNSKIHPPDPQNATATLKALYKHSSQIAQEQHP